MLCRPQTVPIAICFVIWACISIFFILLVETLRALAEKGRYELRTFQMMHSQKV